MAYSARDGSAMQQVCVDNRKIDDDNALSDGCDSPTSNHITPKAKDTVPLVSSKMMNIGSDIHTKSNPDLIAKNSNTTTVADSQKKSSADVLLGKLNDQQLEYEDRKKAKNQPIAKSCAPSKTGALPKTITSLTDAGLNKGDHKSRACDGEDIAEIIRLKQELVAANSKIARQDEELYKARAIKDADATQAIGNMQDAFAAQRSNWPPHNHEDARSDVSEAFSTGSFQSRPPTCFASSAVGALPFAQAAPPTNPWPQASQRPFANRTVQPSLQPLTIPQAVRPFGQQVSPISSAGIAAMPGFAQYLNNQRGAGRTQRGNAMGSSGHMMGGSGGSWAELTPSSEEWSPVSLNGMYPSSLSSVTPMQSPVGMMQCSIGGVQGGPPGIPFTNTAADYSAPGVNPQWAGRSSSPNSQVYIDPHEPINYRRLLDKNASSDWTYIVSKIVGHNDQQASIFLQQKLKVGTAKQKFEIVQSITSQAYKLMINRFGNFLVQRCFEHGTPEQVNEIAEVIVAHTLALSMDPFGCHVVQKAFDAVTENYKARMVVALLRRIPETVVHRYACHVWQKLFELRWNDSPPQIMKYVNEALHGMWHQVALGETGSLVVQNIFENCLEEDKRPCIEEVLNSIDIIAHGQFGNWCIQHICEHGAAADRTRAVDHVLRFATEYSIDQFASKVVEKCLKIGGTEFLDRYLARVCEGQPDRPRIPLIDIASDQYGNYLIQYILTHASAQHRELVASHIRKHMVSLRGSKFGSRVGMLCSNPGYATRPAVGMGMQNQRFTGSTDGYNGNTISGTMQSNVPSAVFPGNSNGGSNRYTSNFR